MSLVLDRDVGKIWVPGKSLSLPDAPSKRVGYNIWRTKIFRPGFNPAEFGIRESLYPQPDYKRQVIQTIINPLIAKGEFNPEWLKESIVYLDIGVNERVDKGGDINITRLFGAASGASTAAGVLTAMAIASASITVAHGDLSLGSGSANVTTSEFTTIGLSRTAATVQNYVATTTLDATVSVDLFKSFSVSGSGTAYGAGLFDSTTVSGSFLFVEKLFSNGSATVANLDTLQVTITITL